MTKVEEWRDVRGYEGLYMVSNLGNVYSQYTNKKLKPTKILGSNSVNYFSYRVTLYKNKVGTCFYVSILVCETFHGPRPEGMQVRHLDSDTINNRLSNLVWGTPQENSDDIDTCGSRAIGTKHGLAVLTENIVRSIRQNFIADAPVKRGYYTRLGERYGVTNRTVIDVITCKTWAWVI